MRRDLLKGDRKKEYGKTSEGDEEALNNVNERW